MSASTVSRVLKRLGINKLSALEPAEPPRRYQRERPGELIHIDIKKLGKFESDWPPHHRRPQGPEQPPRRRLGVRSCLHRRRLARGLQQGHEERTQASAVAFLKAAVAYYASLGITVERVMTDNGSCYRSAAFAKACRRLSLKHIRTRPYTPRTNGKAERFIQTALREWAYARAYNSSDERTAELPRWLHRYNWHRPHGSIGAKPPISRLGLTGNNLLRLHS